MIQGTLFGGRTSSGQEVSLHCNSQGQVSVEGGNTASLHFSELKISPRIGQTSRYVTFPNGSQFETDNNDAIDALLVQWQSSESKIQRALHRLESHWRNVSLSVIFLVFFGWGLVQYGIPHFSRELALAAPAKISQLLGDSVLKSIEEIWVQESTLGQIQQQELTAQFQALVPNDEYEWQILFRQGGILGANAFALPNGTIVMTDELVQLAHNQQQLISIMAHEVGHVIHRHGLRTLIQKSSLAVLLVLVTGDVSTSSSIITALPAILIEAGYSQTMEREADTYALEYLQQQKIDPIVFAEIMHLLEYHQNNPTCQSSAHASDTTDETSQHPDCVNPDKQNMTPDRAPESDQKSINNYFSTHPSTHERIERFRQASDKIPNDP